jgi:hypothetical protein
MAMRSFAAKRLFTTEAPFGFAQGRLRHGEIIRKNVLQIFSAPLRRCGEKASRRPEEFSTEGAALRHK